MKIWKKKEIDIKKEDIINIAKKYNISLLEATLLLRREIKEEDFLFFTESSVNLMHNPFLLKNINKFIYRMNEAIEEKENILIFGDKDADGITATIIMYETLKNFGLNVTYKIPSNGEFYGITKEIIDKAYEDKISIIITVDCGISNIEEANYAKSKNIEVIITDHHLPNKEIDTENIIINPHIQGDLSPFKDIAGCYVSFKACLALCLSTTNLYNKNIVFLFLERLSNNIVLHAIEIRNYILKKYLMLESNNDLQVNINKLEEFSKSKYIIVFNKDEQNQLINKFFNKKIDIETIDISENFVKKYPKFARKTLKELMQITKYFKYKEIDIKEKLYYIFYNIIFEVNKDLLKNCLKKLKFVAIGTIADNMPIINENRIVVKAGLKEIALRENISINYLLKEVNILTKTRISSTDIAFKIAPILNSTGRLEKADITIQFLLTEDSNKIENKFKEIKNINTLRKRKEETSWNTHNDNIIFKNDKFIVCYDKHTPKGISSRMATRLASYYQKVAVFLTKQENIIKGSIRSNNKVNSKELISMIPSHLMINSGGHKAAAGFTLYEDILNEFVKELENAIEKIKYSESYEDSILIDATIPKNFKKEELFKIIDLFEPYGHGFREFILTMEDVCIQDIRTIDKNGNSKHISMKIKNNRAYYKAIYFNGTQNIQELGIKDGQNIDIIFTIGEDFYNQSEKLLKIIDIKKR
ncbi:single-stranded-DNA-specific exonuclease RecJ [Borrelia miyamotoi]|uniref:Single-stranded-DNA-specific exonuclease RecJ n=1 Tax=Borrelia miyamotoi TaxID=47466 RepID=A0AAP8YU54_9SPIR|nr:single-stranded-DNA-specific exonuclease RecJ [Borrelia miyamotoi]AHH05161.1 Single-stranded-DNA-specific exonuclease recJ [Borrelia miyamotoi FR64b]ATQ14946.1 single-stranded-DNA-specific exonuclease RecJ [Borrelia miyamotoi]ATQ16129.1 single-stranded-DNA-specific exonuclease RecJ [Borrelia miyamotoi]ATQ17274.1 single-stranded-DNA-specific exonuclease RecJ [Borrelia miyamotoi]ATQ18220.1 single-stranded-DNA-specific exonuclease RecJ [Borrelia miyamotoi]